MSRTNGHTTVKGNLRFSDLTLDIFETNRMVVTRSRFLHIDGQLQIQENVIHVKARFITSLELTRADVRSHGFH